MKPTTIKALIHSMLGGIALGTLASIAQADAYPERPITMIVPFPAGGITDTLGRATATQLGDALGVNVVVTNKQGGAGTIGMAQIAKSRPDGYTIAVVPAAPLVSQPNLRRLPYDAGSFDYVCQIFNSPMVLAVKPGSDFHSLDEVISYSRQHPGELTYGVPGMGSLPHLAMEQLQQEFDMTLRAVPFTGDAPGVTALMGGHIDLYLATGTVVSDKELDAVAAFADGRIDGLPDLPTAREQGYDISVGIWGGVIAPKGLDDAKRERLAEACADIGSRSEFRAQLKKLGTELSYSDAVAFQGKVDSASTSYAKLIDQLGLAQ